MNRLKEIEARLAAIGDELTRDGADLDALESEIEALKEERASIEQAVEKRAALIADVEKNGRVLRTFPAQEQRATE
jgi:septal ring factor EnvC (AmiA/AmiB activator)